MAIMTIKCLVNYIGDWKVVFADCNEVMLYTGNAVMDSMCLLVVQDRGSNH